jgi:catalase
VGKLVLDRNPENYFAEVEQAAFNPSNLVPGIGVSPDKMLQGRLFSYHDTHLHRLGPNYHLIPVNQAKNAAENNYQRDGNMRVDKNGGSGPNYWPNSFNGPAPDNVSIEPDIPLEGVGQRHEFNYPNDDFVQPGKLYSVVMTDQDRANLVSNIVGNMETVPQPIQLRQCALFYLTHEDYGSRVAQGLGLDMAEVKRLAGMTQEERVAATQVK